MFTVSTAGTNAMTTLATVKLELKIEGNTDDAWLRAQIDSLSQTACRILGVAESETGTRNLGRETLVETIDQRAAWPWTRALRPIIASNEHDGKLILSRRPVVSISSITEDGVMVDPTEYKLSAATGTVRRLSGDMPIAWPSSLIVVTYLAGWLMPGQSGRNLPTDWEDAVISAVKQAWFSRTRDPAVKRENNPGVFEQEFFFGTPGMDSPFPQDAMAKLRFARDVSI
jgi:hypothetical protein